MVGRATRETPSGRGGPTATLRRAARAVWRLLRTDVTRNERGVALLLAMAAVAVLAAFSVEFAFNMRVAVHQASNMQKEVQAYYNARSAMEISRAVIFASRQFQSLNQLTGGRLGNMQLWRYSCDFAKIFSTGKVEFLGKDLFDFQGQEGIGALEGTFECEVIPEDGKISVARTANLQQKGAVFREVYAMVRQYYGLDDLSAKDKEVAELVLNIIDWIDPDETRSDVDPATGAVTDAGAPETGNYSRYGYEARNAKPDTNAELRLVEGMTDELACHLGDKFTVYPTDKVDVNVADNDVLKALICEYLQGDIGAVCFGAGGAGGMGGATAGYGFSVAIDYVVYLIDQCRSIKKAMRMPPFRNPQEFVQMFGKLPAPFNALVQVNQAQLLQAIDTTSNVLRVRAVGQVGNIQKTLEAVLDTGSGTFVYWKEW